jgi:hypothetical protein
MLKSYSTYREAAFAMPRQMWLASLGAAVATRDFVRNDAGVAFKSLVKQGTSVESKAIRVFGERIETSMTQANALWRRTRSTVEGAVKGYADQAVALAQHALPKSLPKIELPFAKAPAPKRAPAKRAKSATGRVVRKAKRRARAAAK